ncbi:hypothetical protein C3378_27710 [Klebsiella michiganensis]|nr:hypothetical protein C3378_27710 [Klebsiella michiganensis]
MMSLWDALRMNMMISYQELVRTFPNCQTISAGRSNILYIISRVIPVEITSDNKCAPHDCERAPHPPINGRLR